MISLTTEESSNNRVACCQQRAPSAPPINTVHATEHDEVSGIDTAYFPLDSRGDYCSRIDADTMKSSSSSASSSSSSCLEEFDLSGLLASAGPTTYLDSSTNLQEEEEDRCVTFQQDNDYHDDDYDDESSSSATSSETGSSTTMIQFAEEIQYYDVLRRIDYSAEERAASWYTADEYHAVKQEVKDLIGLFNACGHQAGILAVDDVEGDDSLLLSSPRGLEKFLQQGAEACKRNIALGMKAVLDEQERQQMAGIYRYYDYRAIARQYRKVTLQSRFCARNSGLKDREEAQHQC